VARRRETYQQRIDRLMALGYSRAQARGHPRLGEPRISDIDRLPPRTRPMERAVDALAGGATLAAAGRANGVSARRLSRYVKLHNLARRTGRAWLVADRRVMEFPVASEGRWVEARLQGKAALSKAGWALDRQHRAIESADPTFLAPLADDGVTDANGRFIPFMTDMNALFALFNQEEPVFPEIYRETDR